MRRCAKVCTGEAPGGGGAQVMAANGVSHQVVEDDLEGVRAVLTWLAFTPVRLGGPPPHLPSADPADRAVAVAPAEGERASRPGEVGPHRPRPLSLGDFVNRSLSLPGLAPRLPCDDLHGTRQGGCIP